MKTLELNQDEIRALLDLIEFHEDWEEIGEVMNLNVEYLWSKIHNLFEYK